MEKLKLYGKKVKIKERDQEMKQAGERKPKEELTQTERLFLKEYFSWRKEVRDEFLKRHSKGGKIKIRYLNGKGEMEFDMKKLGIERDLDQGINNKEVFLGTIYVNEKKEIVIDVKDAQLKKDLLQEINRELNEYGGIKWPKAREDDVIYTEEEKRELREKLELFFKKDRNFEKDVEELRNLWRENARLSIRKEKLLNKKNQRREIEKTEKEMKEIEEKIAKKMGAEEFWWKVTETGASMHEILFVTNGLGCEGPSSPLFLGALRNHLIYSRKKYGDYVLRRLVIVEED